MNTIRLVVKKLGTNRPSEEHGMARAHYLLFLALVLLFGQRDANAETWQLYSISYPIVGEDIDKSTGPTVFGINPESPDGKYLAFPEYYEGHAQGDHGATPVPVFIWILNRETGERWLADTATANNHNGANIIWLGNSMIAYHKKRNWSFSVYDLNTRQIIVDDEPGDLPHQAQPDVIYYSVGNWKVPGESDREPEDMGVWKYDIETLTATQMVSTQRIIRYLDNKPNYIHNNTSGGVNHVDPSPSGDTVTFLMAHDSDDHQMLVDSDGTNLRKMAQRPFHALWFDEFSMLGASRSSQDIKVVKRVNMDGYGTEILGGDGAHAGVSPDLEWVTGELAPGGAYEEDSDGDTNVYLYGRGVRKPVARLAKWDNGYLTWDRVAHANPAFSGDGNRLYYLRSYDHNFKLNYVNLESYKKTIKRYCATGVPFWSHVNIVDDRYIKSIEVTKTDENGANKKILVPKLTYDEYPEHGYQYLYHVPYSGVGVSSGDQVTVAITANDASIKSKIKGYVDWNQSFLFFADTELVFTKGSADQSNPSNLSFTKTFTVPVHALAGDTLMRIRFYHAWDDNPGACGSKLRTTTYDLPIKVAYSGSNACWEGDQIEANTDENDAGNAFDDDRNSYWSANRDGYGAWIKKCFTTPRKLTGIEFDGGDLDRRYKFDIELLDSAKHLWFKALENQRSLGNDDDSEKYYFSKEARNVDAAAVRFVGYGNNSKRQYSWSNIAELGMLRGPTKSAVLTGDAHVAHGYCGNHGSDKGNRLVVQDGKVRHDSFLKFELDNLPNSVDEATLWLKVRNVPAGSFYNSLHVVGNNWNENNITGVNLPSVGEFINAFPTPGKDQWLKVDITSQVNAAKTADANHDDDISLRLTSPNKREGVIWYYSSEAVDPRNRPQLTYVVAVNN